MNATKTPDTEDIETAPNSPLILNDILTPDTKIKQTTSFSDSFQESFSSLKSELCELKLSLTNEICEKRNSICDIKAKTDVHSEQVKDNKRLWDELETKNTIIKLLIDNFKQLADSIGKPNTLCHYSKPLISQKTAILYCQRNMYTKNLTINQNQQIYYHQIVISY